jgi:hypothetical protein
MFKEFLLGKRSRLSWVDETSFGTGGNMATNGVVVGLNAVIEPDFNQNWQEILSNGAGDRTIQGHELGPLDLPFTLTFTPVDWKFLRYSGYNFTNTGGSAPYTHTGTLQNSIRSFKLEWANLHTTPVVLTLTGCTVVSTTINFSKGSGDGEGMIIVSLSCIAKGVTPGSTVTTLASGNITRAPFHYRNVKLTNNNLEIVEINNGEFTIDQGISAEDSRYCNATLDREIGEPIPKTHRISGRYNMNLKDNTEINQWVAGAVINNCKLEFIKDAASDYMQFSLDGFKIGQGIPPVVLDGVTASDIVWICNKFNPIEGKDNLNTY